MVVDHAQRQVIQLRALWAGVTVSIACMFGVVGSLVYFAYYEPAWLSYPNPELPVLAESVVAGEVIPVEVTRVNKSGRLRVYQIAREMHCDSLPHPVVLEGSPPSSIEYNGGLPTTATSYANRVPTMVAAQAGMGLVPMPSGTCWIEGATEINGRIRTITVTWHTPNFRVISKADAARQVPDPGGVS